MPQKSSGRKRATAKPKRPRSCVHDYSDVKLELPNDEHGEEVTRALDAVAQRLERDGHDWRENLTST